jgi:hypothetical protein
MIEREQKRSLLIDQDQKGWTNATELKAIPLLKPLRQSERMAGPFCLF